MENKRRCWSVDDAGSCNDIEIDKLKKRKFSQDDGGDCLINKSRKRVAEVCKNCKKFKSRSACAPLGRTCKCFDYVCIDEEFVSEKNGGDYLINKSRKRVAEVCKNCKKLKSRSACAPLGRTCKCFDYVCIDEEFVSEKNGGDYLINKSRKRVAEVCKNCKKLKSRSACAPLGRTCKCFDYVCIDEEFVSEKNGGDYLINKSRKRVAEVCKNCKKLKSRNVCALGKQCSCFDYTSTDDKFVWGNKIEPADVVGDGFADVAEDGFSCTRPTNMETKISVSMEEQRERMEEIEPNVVEEGFSCTRSINTEIKNLVEEQKRKENRVLGRINLIDGLLMCLDEPCLIFEKLEVKDMECLREDIIVYLDLDRATPSRKRFWEALLVVCDWELAKARNKEALDRARVRGEISPAEFLEEEKGLHLKTESDVKYLLEGDSYSKIKELQSEIESVIWSGSAIGVEFWEPVLKHVRIYKAKAFLKEESHAAISQEGTGSSFSPGEETGDNFEMDGGDRLSRNIEGVMGVINCC